MHKKMVALTLLATLLVGSPGLLFAFGLGEIEINSALNQPMNAEIDLVGFSAATIDEVQVELASQEMFERVGVPRPYILTRLKFTPMISNGKPVIKVTSTDAIREPFLTFLVDVRWAKGKLLREYTVLLDPPVFGEKARATIQAPKVATKPVPAAPIAVKPVSKPRTAANTPAPRVPTPSVRPNQAAVPSTASKPVTLKKTKSRPVRRGDTLWSIAEPYARENGVSVNQMMLAIQEANPQSFSKDNINNLKSGVVLRIPADEAPKYSAREALAEVRRQWQVWKQGTQADSTPVNVDASDMADGEVMETPQPTQEKAKPTDSSLSILGDGEVAAGKTGDDANATLKELRKQVNLLKENTQSKGQENAELKGRIESLESMIKKQEDIISLQNEQLAQLQNTLTVDSSDLSEQAEAEENVMDAAEQALASAQQQAEELAVEIDTKSDLGIKAATVEPLPDFSGPIPEEFLAADQADQPESLVAEAEVVAEVTPVESVVEVSLIEKITSMLKDQGKTLLYAGGALIALLLGWLGIKRRNANLQNSDLEANGLPAFEEEPSFDEMLDDTVIATPDSVDEALDDLDTVDAKGEPEENVFAGEDTSADSDDVLAEADVYISYGLYQQAEELLKDGLAKEPNNVSYQVKLAEIYYADKKSDEFVQHVEAMESGVDKQSPEWSKIASMGAALVPAHALFAGADASSATAIDNAEIGAIDTDDIGDFDMAAEDMEDFDSDDLDDNSLDFTFGDDGELSDDISEVVEDAPVEATQTFAADAEDDVDMLEESSTAILEAGLDFDTDDDDSADETVAFDMDDVSTGDTSANDSSDNNDVFLDFDGDALENELNTAVSHDGETEMLDPSLAASFDPDLDLDDAINLDDDLGEDSTSAGIKIDNDLDDMLDDDNSETAMFDSSLFDVNSPEAKAFAGDDSGRVDEDTVSLEQVQENLTAELETLSFDAEDIDPESMEEDSLPTLQTSELGKPDLDLDDMNESLTASETGTFEKDMLADDVTEQFDVGNIDSTMTDLGEFADDYELENPSVIEEVGTKLDLAKAFVDMGDEDAAKETLTEVIEQGDQTQIQQAKDLLDKLN